MLIRACVAADVDVLEEHLPTGRNQVHAWFVGRQREGVCTYLAAYDDGVPVGTCVLSWEGLADPAARAAFPDCTEIRNLAVTPARRGEGFGTALIRHAEQLTRARLHTRVGLGVGVDNPAALRLYQRLGYADTGLRWNSTYRYYDPAGVEHTATEHNLVLVRALS